MFGVLDSIIEKLEKIMALGQDILDLLNRIDIATSAIAARIQKLIDLLTKASGGLTAEEAQAIADKLSVETAALEAMGKDPANPV